MKDDLMLGDTPKARKRRRRLKGAQSAGRLWKHATLSDILGVVSAGDMQRYLTFTLVRNPWDRIVSYYHWLKAQDFEHPAVALSKTLKFQDFVAHPHIQKTLRAAPYSSYMQLGGREVPSLYVRLEHFTEDAAPLWDHLGFELTLPRVNTSNREPDYRTYYDRGTQAIVADICGDDINRFGYEF